jgi:predicted dehydrogenase
MALQAAVIGCGRPFKSDGSTGFGMSHKHVFALKKAGVDVVAAADISQENAAAFGEVHGITRLYTDYREMLAAQKFDWVSICTWPALHAEMTIAAAQSGARSVYCEKPMAPTFGEAKAMVAACQESGTQLAFNHQRRFGTPFQQAKKLLDEGAIGELKRLEAQCGDMFDWGTHWIDMQFFFNNETPAEWVIGQVDLRDARKIFGVTLESQGLCQYQFQNGVQATLFTGKGSQWMPNHRLIGSEGIIEIGAEGADLRLMNATSKGWKVIGGSSEGDGIHGDIHIERAIADAVDALQNNREPLLSGANALRTTEVIFATYESSRRGGRVDLPLDVDDSALQARLEAAGLAQ